jgi:hypothetical protein
MCCNSPHQVLSLVLMHAAAWRQEVLLTRLEAGLTLTLTLGKRFVY